MSAKFPRGGGGAGPFLAQSLFIEHDGFNFFTTEGRIRAVMYMSCVKCACSELNWQNICILSSF